jgi:enoyl-CoA hydratase
MSSIVEVEQPTGGVSVVRLSRPEKKNALSIALRDAVSDVLDRLEQDATVRVVVITGAGPVFSAGFDLGEFVDRDEAHQERLWASSDRFHHRILGFPLPVVAAVNGPALAGGFDLAVLADLRIAARSATFAHVEQSFGDVVYRPLKELIGGGVARELVLTGRSVDANEALRIGLVNAVVPDERVLEAAVDVAIQIARAPRDLLRRTKAKIIAAAAIDRATRTLDL